MQDTIATKDQFFKLLEMNIEEACSEYSRVTMPLREQFTNGMGFAHGGAVATLLDMAFAAASNCDAQTSVVSLSMNIQYLAPGRVGPLVAEAHLVKGGRTIVTYDLDVHDGAGAHVAHASAQGFRTQYKVKE